LWVRSDFLRGVFFNSHYYRFEIVGWFLWTELIFIVVTIIISSYKRLLYIILIKLYFKVIKLITVRRTLNTFWFSLVVSLKLPDRIVVILMESNFPLFKDQ